MILTKGRSDSDSLYGRLGVFYHRMTIDGRKRRALCNWETWSAICEWDLSNDPPWARICPRCKTLMEAKGGMIRHSLNDPREEAVSRIRRGDPALVIFSYPDGIDMANLHIHEDDIIKLLNLAISTLEDNHDYVFGERKA